MNRKLHHSLMALSATAAVLGVLLLAAGPLQPRAPTPASMSMDLHSWDRLPAPSALAVEDTVQAVSQRRHLRHSRALFAMPYFSFAQGLRRNRS